MSENPRVEAASVETQCLHVLVEAQVERTPDKVAVEFEGQHLSYEELNGRANQLAHFLRGLRISPHARIAICLKPSTDFAIATLAVLKVGSACVPLDPQYPAGRLAYMLEDVEASAVITTTGTLPAGISCDADVVDLSKLGDRISAEPRTNLENNITASDLAYVIYTSGSTGKPRGVQLAHAGLANYNVAASRYYAMSPEDRVLQFCSVSFDIAVEELFISWLSGATLVFRSERTPLAVPGFIDWIRRQKITVLDLPTAYWHEWMSQLATLRQAVPDSVRLVVVGGEKALSSALANWQRAVGGRVRWINTYGPTEASIAVTRYEPRLDVPDALPSNVPIGQALENCHVHLLDQHLAPVPAGAPGELYIGGICVAKGYWHRSDLTAQRFIPDPFCSDPDARLYKTGDLARYLPSGDLEYLGREDDQVKIRGFRVELGEIEEALARQPGVREAVVVAVQDPQAGKLLVVYVSPSSAQFDTGELRSQLSRELPDYMLPSAFVLMETLPKTPNGKVDRRGLTELGLPAPRANTAFEAPTNELESQLVRIWEDTLGRRPIGISDNFFELGGHSLLAARLMHQVSRAVRRTVPLALLFEAPTIEQLAVLLQEDRWSHHWSCLVPIQPEGSKPPFFCVHGVGGNVLGFRELARRMSPDYPFYGLQAQGLDGSRPCLASVESMAAHYIREMRSVQPEGPFFIGGYSFGGLVAYEMAHQLQAGGEQVALLALLDTYPGNLKSVGTSILEILKHPSRLVPVGDLAAIIQQSVQRRVKGWFLSKALRQVLAANHIASDQYILRPYPGKTTLFRAQEVSLRSFDDPHAAWNDLAVGGLDVKEVAGRHGDILVAPQVSDLAEKLKACIDDCAPRARVQYLTAEDVLQPGA